MGHRLQFDLGSYIFSGLDVFFLLESCHKYVFSLLKDVWINLF